jgi:hypothetical protein
MSDKLEKIDAFGFSWILTNILLVIGTFYEVIYEDGLGDTSIIFFLSQAIYWITKLYRKDRG